MNKRLEIPALKCLRCSYSWIPRRTMEPQVCPACNSPYWNKRKWKGIEKHKRKNHIITASNSKVNHPVYNSVKRGYGVKTNTNLEHLFKPRSIAVIGATAKPTRVGRIIFENLLRSDRSVYPVHPSEQTILGHKVFNNIADLPSDVDLAVIATSTEQTVEIAEECGRCKIPFIIPVAGGFSETGVQGKKLEERLHRVVKKYGSRILGPNTLGIFAPQERIDTIFVEHGDRALGQGGGVAFITQSGSVGVEALGIESNIGFGLRAFVGLGNKVDLDEVDFMNYFRNDPRTTCVALYVESLPDGRSFIEAAREVSKRKPVVALKAGRTVSAAAAVSSHTGHLAGSDRVIDSAFRQFGIQRVLDEEQLCDAARVLSMAPLPRGNRVAVLSPGGGYGIMSTDGIETTETAIRLTMAKLSHKTESAIRSVIPSFASAHNPVDLSTLATDDMTISALSSVLEDEGVDIVLCMTLFAPPGISDGLIRKIGILVHSTSKPIIAVCQFGPFSDGHISRLYDYGVIGFPSVSRSVRAIRRLVERAQIQKMLNESL